MRALRLVLAVAALIVAAPALGGGYADLGGYGGLFLPGSNHELYDARDAEHRRLGLTPGLGLRFGVFPWETFGGELEGDMGVSRARDAGGVALSGWRAHAVIASPGLLWGATPFALVGGGNLAVFSSDDKVGTDVDRAMHWGFGASLPAGRMVVRADFRHVISAHHDVVKTPGSHFGLQIGVAYRMAAPERPDLDGDGVADDDDACPDVAGDLPDGCPGATVRFVVEDGDYSPVVGATVTLDGDPAGVTGADGGLVVSKLRPGRMVTARAEFQAGGYYPSDFHPMELAAGEVEQRLRVDWVPRKVRTVARLVDGTPVDARVTFIGPEPIRPVQLGADGEQVHTLRPGEWTLLFEADGAATQRRVVDLPPGPPDEVLVVVEMPGAKVEITSEEVVVLEKIFFDFDSARIRRGSIALVEEIAANLLAHPELSRVEVAGHTDAIASPEYNMELSQRRVDAVVTELVERGVARQRLVPVGYGESRPLDTNETEAGREKNRRVEFVILDRR